MSSRSTSPERSLAPIALHGVHHVTAISADARANHAFYTGILGMRLVKKTVNQDDTSAYHLFYADAEGTPGTDLTFFEWPVGREVRGTSSVTSTGLRVSGEASLVFWQERLKAHAVAHGPITEWDGRLGFEFEDFEGQRLRFIDDGGLGAAYPWVKSTVPSPHQIRGLGPLVLSVPKLARTDAFLTKLYGMRLVRDYAAPGSKTPIHVYQMGADGPQSELHIAEEPHLGMARQGAGGVHHIAFRARNDDEYNHWVARYQEHGLRSSGPVDRFYFKSLYVREPGGILIEIATDGPGFSADEPKDSMGEHLSLPPFLEHDRVAIEAGLKPL